MLAALAATRALAVPVELGNPFAHARLYVNPSSDAAVQAQAWSRSRPWAAAQMRKIAREPVVEWYGDRLADPGALFRRRVRDEYQPDHATAFIAVYDLPHRDCFGRFSAGGARGAGAYEAWIRSMTSAIGSYPAIVIVEPDGLPDSPCLGPLAGERLALIAYAAKTLASLPSTSVYIDAGRSDWLPASRTISLLRRAGVKYTRGFALDVTGYASTREELAYGDRIGAALGGKHFVVNTSRNGNGPLGRSKAHSVQELWCNTPGRALGPRPTTHTGDSLADAYEWILHPGYSDGRCQGGQAAGTWWPSYALGLASRAHYTGSVRRCATVGTRNRRSGRGTAPRSWPRHRLRRAPRELGRARASVREPVSPGTDPRPRRATSPSQACCMAVGCSASHACWSLPISVIGGSPSKNSAAIGPQ